MFHSSKVFALDLGNQSEVNDSQTSRILGNLPVEIHCISSSCVSSKNHSTGEIRGYDKLTFYMTTKRNAERLNNALTYVLSLAKEKAKKLEEYERDPFSNSSIAANQVIANSDGAIPLTRSNGVYFINVRICGNPQKFTFDSGASDVLISTNMEQCLIQNRKISKADFLVPALYEIADGTIVHYRRVKIPEISIGGYLVKNVVACVGSTQSSLLPGKSFLDKFSSWTIDNDKSSLILNP